MLLKPYRDRLSTLEKERASWDAHWRDISTYIAPRRSRFFASDTNRGDKKNQSIINGTPIFAARTLASGMMAGVTSPARRWFSLTTPDPSLAEHGSVRAWLHVVTERIRQVMHRSNLYKALHETYSDLIAFGTAVLYVEDDAEEVLRAYVFPVGSFYLANSPRLVVDTCYRRPSMTVGQLVRQFGEANVSQRVKDMHEKKQLDTWIEVVHAITPNDGYQPGKLGPKGKRFASCWFEKDATEEKFLREAGYDESPALAVRWETNGEDVYGSSPAMHALGDARALQLYEKRKAEAVEKLVRPPMRAPTSLMNQRVTLNPGDHVFVDSLNPGQAYAPAIEVNHGAIQATELSIREHEARINRAMYADLWLMLAHADQRMTATEVAERHEEKMLQLGPVMERLEDELLDPLIDRVFGILLRGGHIPPPPREIQGQELRVEYISIMAQAQKMLGTTSIERVASFVGNLAAVKPDVVDKVDFDQAVDAYSNMLDTPPDLVRTDEQVAEIRASRAKQAAEMQQAEAAAAAVQGAKTLSETDMQGDSALKRVLGNVSPAAAAATGRA